MKNSFIPLNDNINKLIAFAPSLDKNWRNSQRIKQKPFQIETLEAITGFQNQGWKLAGVFEEKGKNLKIRNHSVRMVHPDFSIKDKKSDPEAVIDLYIQNSCDGSGAIEMDLGLYRKVCANGLVSKTNYSSEKLKHTKVDFLKLPQIISQLSNSSQNLLNEFEKFKHVQLSPRERSNLVKQAAIKRFGENHQIDASQLLNVVRDDDKGDNLWLVYNRIQENLTQSNMILDSQGRYIPGINNVNEDINLNKELFELVHSYV